MSLKDIFRRFGNLTPKSSASFLYAIIDSSNNTLVTIGDHPAAFLFVAESTLDTEIVSEVPPSERTLYIMRSNPRTYPEWSWDSRSVTFKKTNPTVVSEDMRARAILASEKMHAVSSVIFAINRLRNKINTGLIFQIGIYAEKEKQAQALKDSDFNETSIASAPYVVQYAEDNQFSIQQSAEEILLRSKLDNEYLAKTERVRLSLLKKIKLAKTPHEVEKILTAFTESGVS